MNPHDVDETNRRPIASRNLRLFRRLSAALARVGLTPNAISIASMVFAALAGTSLWLTSHADGSWVRVWWVVAAVAMPARLLANMLDGMVAQESGLASSLGELYNEVPDRISDSLILIGAGCAIGGVPALGWAAALIAIFIAYVRAVGLAAGAGQAFHGPMAKPHRMFILIAVCAYCGVTPTAWQSFGAESQYGPITIALTLIIAGGAVTAARRLVFIGARLRQGDRT